MTSGQHKIEILEIKSDTTYNPALFNQPLRITAKVNGFICDYISKISPSLKDDLEWYGVYKSEDEILDMIREEAEAWYLTNICLIRKKKLEQINANK